MRPLACSDRELGSQSTKAILLLSCTADNPNCKGESEGGMKAPLALLVKLDLQYTNMRVLEHKTRFHTGHSSVKKTFYMTVLPKTKVENFRKELSLK